VEDMNSCAKLGLLVKMVWAGSGTAPQIGFALFKT